MFVEELKIRIESFSELEKNWDGYNADEITISSIITAHGLLDSICTNYDLNSISVFPMRNGGIQLEIGDYKEIEILNDEITEIEFDSFFNVIRQLKSVWK